MSQENVEIVRKHFEAFQRGEFDLATALWDPEGEWIPAMGGAVENRVYRGHTELRRYAEELFESFSEVRPEDIEFRDLGNRVLSLYRLRVRGRDSGIRKLGEDNTENFDVWRIQFPDVRDLGDRVLAIGTLHIRGRGGGVETDVPTAGIASFDKQGNLIRWEDFGDRRLALEAAGLGE